MNPVFRVEEYVQVNGVIPYKLWFDSLDVQAAANERAKNLLAEYKERKTALARGAKRKK